MVSIIVPIYNSIFYLKECIQSLLSQTVDDLEIILIDDCSTDDVMSVIESIVSEYRGKKTIRVHRNVNNLGSSATRNLGIEMAQGEYICFVDCNHFIAPDYIEVLLAGFSKADNIGIVMSLHSIVSTVNGLYQYIPSRYEKQIKECRLLKSVNFAEEMWTGVLPDTIFGKIYKRHLFETNKFRIDRLHPDFSFFLNLAKLIEEEDLSTLIIPNNNYYTRKGNWYDYTRHCKPDYFMEKIIDFQNALSLCIKDKRAFTPVIRKSLLLRLLSTIRFAASFGLNTKEAYSVLHAIIKKQKNLDAQKVLSKSDYKTFLKMKYLPFFYRWMIARSTYKQTINNWHHLPIPFFNLGNRLEVACVSKAGSSHLKSILIYMNKGLWILDDSLNIHMICEEHNYFKTGNLNKKVLHFSVYMDPFRRLVSTYQDKLKGGKPNVYFNQLGMGEQTTFKTFMKYVRKELLKKDPLSMDIHIRPQVLSLGNYHLDVIVPSQYLNDFLQENGIPIPPKLANVSKKPKDYSEFEPYRNEIKKLYSCDYDILHSPNIYEPGKGQ